MISKPLLDYWFWLTRWIECCFNFTSWRLAIVVEETLFNVSERALVLFIRNARSELNHPKGKEISLNTSLGMHLRNLWIIRTKDFVRAPQQAIILLTLIAISRVTLLQWMRLKIRLFLVCCPVRHPHQLEHTNAIWEVNGRLSEGLSRSYKSYPEIDFLEIDRLILQFVLRKEQIALRRQLSSLVL